MANSRLPLPLPERASLEYLRKLAKERLREARIADPTATLAAAQLSIAREYGFPSWRALKAEVDKRRTPRLDEFFAAIEDRDVAAVRALLAADPSLARERHRSGSTPLHEVVGHPELVRLLLDHGADPNARDVGDNATPLHFAAAGAPLESVLLLLDAGADVNGFGDLHESGVIGWAVGDGVDVRHDVVALLLERGARHHIFSAIGMGDLDLVQSLVEENPDALSRRRSRFEQRQTPLHFALAAPDGLRTKPAQYDIAALLIELGADIEAEDARGRTPLAVAMLRGDVRAMQLLESAGAKQPGPVNTVSGRERMTAMRASMAKQVVPMLCVRDIDATVAWFLSLGFTLDERYPPKGPMNWAALSFGKVWLMVQPRVARPHEQIALWFYTTAIDDLYALFRNRQLDASKATLSGSEPEQPAIRFLEDLYEPFYGGRQFSVQDPNGFELVFHSEPSST
jgi:ankyrin repeat protein